MANTFTAGTDRATGYVVSAALWNLLWGDEGSIDYLGETHDHATTPGGGDGSLLGLKACLAANLLPLGRKQDSGELLRIEYKESGIQSESDGGSYTHTVTWDNAFATLLTVICIAKKATDTGTFVATHLIATSTTQASAKNIRGGVAGNAVNTHVNFLAIGY